MSISDDVMPAFREAFAADFQRLLVVLQSAKSSRWDMDATFRAFQLAYFKSWHPLDPFMKQTMECAEIEYRNRRFYA